MQEFIARAKLIKLLILDADGVLTDGLLNYTKDGILFKSYHVRDGLGIKLLQRSGLEVAIISTCPSGIIGRRSVDLGIKHVYEACENKLAAYQELKKRLQLEDKQIAYLGDDLPDLPLISRVGLGLTVAGAPALLQQQAVYTSQAPGGQGAVREICELIMQAQGTFDAVLEPYHLAEVT